MSEVSLYPLLLEKKPTAGEGVTQKSIEFGPLVAKRLAPGRQGQNLTTTGLSAASSLDNRLTLGRRCFSHLRGGADSARPWCRV